MNKYVVKSRVVMACYDIVEATSVEEAMDAVRNANNRNPLLFDTSVVDVQDVVQVKSFRQWIRQMFDNPPTNYAKRLIDDFCLKGK